MLVDQFYCVSCQKKVRLPSGDIHVKTFKTKRRNVPALVGKCHKCNVKVTKFIKVKDTTKFAKKYGRSTGGSARKSRRKSSRKSVRRSRRRSR
jgi:hypothetical protein